MSLLHDCGVSTTTVHRKLVESGIEEPGPEAAEHCRLGGDAFESLPRLARLAPAIRDHHTPWLEVRHEEHAALANLVFLADRVDVLRLRTPEAHARATRESVLLALASRRGSWFAPDLLDALAEASHPEAFWYRLDDRVVEDVIAERRPRPDPEPLSMDDLRGLARMFARIVE